MTGSEESRQYAAAAQALMRNDLVAADRILRQCRAAHPDTVTMLRLLAELETRRDRLPEAERLLRTALRKDPAFAAGRFQLAANLYRQNRPDEAIAELDHLLAANPSDDAARKLKAAVHARFGRADEALAIYEAMLDEDPGQPLIRLSYGHVLKEVGRLKEAVAAYRRVTEATPALGEAWWSLANLKVAALTDADVAAMENALDRDDLSATERLHLHFALGKALEDLASYRRSFGHYAEGNRIRRGLINYDPHAIAEFVNRAKALFTPEFFEARRGFGSPSREPIFVLGMPRSGSTLVEQMLASHPSVEGTAELPDIPMMANSLKRKAHKSDQHSLDWIANLGKEECLALGEDYLRRTRAHRKSERPFFIDKLPNNWQHIAFIHLILPNAAIIDVRRDALGCCFSNFKQHFAAGQEFTYDQREVAAYYKNYVAFLDHLDRSLPGRVHHLSYERLVTDAKAELRALFSYLDLAFDERALRFHANDRAVKTASAQQVRQPLNRKGVDQWRAYEAFLGPMKEILEPLP